MLGKLIKNSFKATANAVYVNYIIMGVIAVLMLINPVEHIWICVALMGCLLRLSMEHADNWAWLRKPRLRFLGVLQATAAARRQPNVFGSDCRHQ